jgi:radical SAM protein with 4Fe4S-binding SPASM domain
VSGLDRAALRAARANVPLSVLFEITGRCSLDCEHCYLDIRHPPEEMSTAEIERILGELAEAGALFLTVSGGEVFLRRDLFHILAHARRLGFAVRLFTSGTRLGRAHARALAALRLVAVEMSLYSAEPAVHDAVTRRPGSFRHTVRAAIRLRRAGVPVVLKAPVLAPTAAGYRELMDLCARLGAEVKLDPGIIIRRDGDPTPARLRPSAEALARVLADPDVFGSERPLPPPAAPDEAPCAIGRRTCRIGPDGSVYPCSTYPDPVGNVRTQSFREIWLGAPSPLLRELRSITWRDVGPTCSSCEKSGYCNRCLALAVIEHGDARRPVLESCRLAWAHDIAHGRRAAPPPGIAQARKSLPIV